jgi:hypothetical protein
MNKEMKSAVSKLKNDRQGAAMIMVLCIMAVFLALSVSILLTASSALNTAKQNYRLEQAKIQCVSFSNLVDDALEDTESSLCEYLQTAISGGDWEAADDNGKETVDDTDIKSYDLSNTYFPMKLEMYWKQPDGGLQVKEGKTNYSDLQLYIDTIYTVSNQEYRIQSRYGLTVDTVTVKDEDGNDIQQDVWRWRLLGRK